MPVSINISRLTLHLIFWSLSLIPVAVGQHDYDCHKYCYAFCNEYHANGGDEFSDCVLANAHCNCILTISFRNPFIYFVFFVGGIILIIGFCYRSVSRGKGNVSHAIVAQPITGNMSHGIAAQPVISNMAGSAAYIIPSNGLPPSASPSYPASPFVIPTEVEQPQAQQSNHELPSEYLPPPEYNTYVQGVNESSHKQNY